MEIISPDILSKFPDALCTEVFSFLTISEVFTVMALVSKRFRNLVKESSEIARNCFKSVCNPNPRLNAYIQPLSRATIIKELKRLFNIPINESIELPYFGFKTDGGADLNSPLFYVDMCFKAVSGKVFKAVCTKEGRNFHIEGALAVDYFDDENIQPTQIEKIAKTRESYMDYLEYMYKTKQSPEKLLSELKDDSYNIESPYLLLDHCIPIISEIEISRRGDFSCPLKTLMLFVAEERVEFKEDPILNLFGNATSKDKLKSILLTNRKQLPQLEYTNIITLKEMSRTYSNDRILGDVKLGIFSNHGTTTLSKLRPLCWIQFTKAARKYCHFILPRACKFSGHFVIAKLIDCEDLREKYDDDSLVTNIDFSYISIKGTLLKA